ncbi:PREDICTED: probable cytochrome P450 313a4 [Rhagoletis zephyria]|uniref:probable cytochrome P450 313a4 n=1 Tax=Rhagoletis zephyria TaxID=28612 RepID=UPI0008119A12|nr:PREDICTED: probable cytochrome P450 313a4 [Rhagoletis zephyria]
MSSVLVKTTRSASSNIGAPHNSKALWVDTTLEEKFQFVGVSRGDVVRAIWGIKSEAIGDDGISLKFVKLVLPFILGVVTHIINHCFTTSCFPAHWKKAIILPVAKKTTPINPSDYRPISILPALAKLITRKIKGDLDKVDLNIFIHRAIDLVRKGDFDWQNVEDECNVIVFGAFETTSNTVIYILMFIAMFPQYQEKLYEEIMSIFSTKDDVEVSYSDIQQMVYLDMVINETMRVMAPVPLVARQTESEVQLSNGVTIPKGLQVAIDVFNMHRRMDIWGPEAHIFNPDNFLPSNLNDKHPYAFIPFTKGIRNCIGWKYALLSIKIAIAKLIWKFRFTTTFEYQQLHYVEDITIKLKETPLFRIYDRRGKTN